MTQYYADADNGSDGNDGLGTGAGNAWATIDQFTENARSAGDILTCRRGTTAQYDDGTDCTFTSDGDKDNPIILEADFDDAWSDNVTTSGETYTTTFGSKTITASATPDAAIVAGTWVYVSTDDPREFAYEVDTVVSNDITLKLPFKGTTGSGLTLVVMKANPVWGNTSAAFNMEISSDLFWYIHGISISGNDSFGQYRVSTDGCAVLRDCIITPGSTRPGVRLDPGSSIFEKCRISGGNYNIDLGNHHMITLSDCLLDGSPSIVSINEGSSDGMKCELVECEIVDQIRLGNALAGGGGTNWKIRNCVFTHATPFLGYLAPQEIAGSSDHDGTIGASTFYSHINQSSETLVALIVEETTTVRSGGSNTSLKVTPGSASTFGTVYSLSKAKLLELPIYATTDNKTYDIYMRPTATTDWTTDPTASELWLELEAWGHATNNFRKITKSTGVIDMNGSTAWQKLSVTVAPAQAGVAFLRLWYAKPVEASKANSFFIDPIPVIT